MHAYSTLKSLCYFSWEFVAALSVPRSNMGGGSCEGKIIVSGGFDGNLVTDITEIYTPV